MKFGSESGKGATKVRQGVVKTPCCCGSESGKVALNTVQLALKLRAGVGAAFHKRSGAFRQAIRCFPEHVIIRSNSGNSTKPNFFIIDSSYSCAI